VPQLVVREDGTVIRLESNARPVGAFKDSEFGTEILTLNKGDKIVLYTDGVIEARNPARQFFSLEGLEKTVRACRQSRAREMGTLIFSEVEAFRGEHPHADDMTVVCAEIL
jgi:phosphoserine phosphatase RsbU/P